jgi:hypothetical protein
LYASSEFNVEMGLKRVSVGVTMIGVFVANGSTARTVFVGIGKVKLIDIHPFKIYRVVGNKKSRDRTPLTFIALLLALTLWYPFRNISRHSSGSLKN